METKKEFLFILGPCAVESEEQIMSIAEELNKLGIKYFRAGAFKPRTNPNSFQGLGYDGLKLLQKVKEKFNMKIVTEVVDTETLEDVAKVADIIQIGSRNMHNYELLKKIAQRASYKDILLKRGFQSTLKEFIGAAEYLEKYGCKGKIYLCERGIRTFANNEYSRFTLDANIVPVLKRKYNYNVLVDPSHTAGIKDNVKNLSYVGVASGADGLIIEVKLNKECKAVCDDDQAITIEDLKIIIEKCKKIYEIVNN